MSGDQNRPAEDAMQALREHERICDVRYQALQDGQKALKERLDDLMGGVKERLQEAKTEIKSSEERQIKRNEEMRRDVENRLASTEKLMDTKFAAVVGQVAVVDAKVDRTNKYLIGILITIAVQVIALLIATVKFVPHIPTP